MPPGLYNAAINGQQAVVRMWLMFVQSPNFALQHIFMIHTRWLGMKKSCQKLIELKGLDPHLPQSCSPCFHISVPLVPMSPYQCSPGPPCPHISVPLVPHVSISVVLCWILRCVRRMPLLGWNTPVGLIPPG